MKDTIRVRIAVAIDSGGEWNASGWGGRQRPYEPDAMSMARECVGVDAAQYWVEVDLPVPPAGASGDPRILPGEVETGENEPR